MRIPQQKDSKKEPRMENKSRTVFVPSLFQKCKKSEAFVFGGVREGPPGRENLIN